MEPEVNSPVAETAAQPVLSAQIDLPAPTPYSSESSDPAEYRGLHWIFVGSQGLRAGWSAAIFILLSIVLMVSLGSTASFVVKKILHTHTESTSPVSAIIAGTIEVLAIIIAGALVALMERRRLLAYNLSGLRRLPHFLGGALVGFIALSALVGAMAWGGWIRFGAVALSGGAIFSFAALWGVSFLLTGLFEEGAFRCFLQYTLTRGINFWWALGVVTLLCLDLLFSDKGNGAWGIYGFALLGLIPCLILHLRQRPGSGFWQATWVTSTLFGFIHTSNNGENWIGIFAAAAIGFVFCVSIRLTGSAWWAIGCHASWDWAETYFYGTADSGFSPSGHYLTTSPVGNPLWSGGADGPEGSLLALGIIVLLLLALLALYGRGKQEKPSGVCLETVS